MSTLQQDTTSTSQEASSISKLNIIQNDPIFELESIENQPPIFRKKLFIKTLDPPKENLEKPENYRTVTVKCLYPSC